MKRILVYTCLMLVTLGSFSLQAQTDYARERALAVRAARLDAIRQLSEALNGVRIDSSTTVKDFVTESDEIKAEMANFIKGAQQIGDPIYNDDGTVEVTLAVSLDQSIRHLKNSWNKYGSYQVDSSDEFDNMYDNTNRRVFIATGAGAVKGNATKPQGDVWLHVSGRGKLMAVRAAKVDAYRNMAETIKGIHIASSTTVRDFVTESDIIRAKFNGVIRGVQFVGRPRYLPEGIVEVTAEINLNKLTRGLSKIARNHSRRYKGNDFKNMKHNYPKRTVRATGVGVPPKKYIRRRPTNNNPHDPYNPNPHNPHKRPKSYVPEWADRTIRVTGYGAFPEGQPYGKAKLMAHRAAELDGYRQLAETIMGLELNSSTTVRDFVTEHDQINTKVTAIIRGAVSSRPIYDDDTAEVEISVYLGDMWQLMRPLYRANK